MKKLLAQHKEKINYLIAGAATTAVNYAVYLALTRLAFLGEVRSNIWAWAASVAFAYVVNRVFVFESKSANILKECAKFVLLRLASGVLDTLMFAFMVKTLLIGDIISKTVTQVVVIILNYIFSKIYVFR